MPDWVKFAHIDQLKFCTARIKWKEVISYHSYYEDDAVKHFSMQISRAVHRSWLFLHVWLSFWVSMILILIHIHVVLWWHSTSHTVPHLWKIIHMYISRYTLRRSMQHVSFFHSGPCKPMSVKCKQYTVKRF